jgi:glycosyltransferase involved in cell wall biosynthesis
LSILDTFALGTPLVTTNAVGHGPEIEYLKNNVNGIMVADTNDPQVYADAAILLLENEEMRQLLVSGCQAARNIYTSKTWLNDLRKV